MRTIILLVRGETEQFQRAEVDDEVTRDEFEKRLGEEQMSLEHLYFNGVECHGPLSYYVDTEPLVAVVDRRINVDCFRLDSDGRRETIELGAFNYSTRIAEIRRAVSSKFGTDYRDTAIYADQVARASDVTIGTLVDPQDPATRGPSSPHGGLQKGIGRPQRGWSLVPDHSTESCKTGTIEFEIKDEPALTGKMFSVSVHTLTGRTVMIETMSDESVLDFMTHYEAIENIPVDQMRMIFAGKQLEHNETMGNYGIVRDSAIHLVLRLRGGGRGPCSFVDITDEGNAVTRAWPQEAPEWRIAQPGLCLEGLCRNPSCAAYGKQVLCNAHFGALDICGHVCRCPACRADVKPMTCGFNNCAYKICGKKVGGDPVSTGFKCVGNEFKHFDGASSGAAEWERLMIVTRPILEHTKVTNGSTCSICLETMKGKCAKLPCEHNFHPHCIYAWLLINQSCPLCRMGLAKPGIPPQTAEDPDELGKK